LGEICTGVTDEETHVSVYCVLCNSSILSISDKYASLYIVTIVSFIFPELATKNQHCEVNPEWLLA